MNSKIIKYGLCLSLLIVIINSLSAQNTTVTYSPVQYVRIGSNTSDIQNRLNAYISEQNFVSIIPSKNQIKTEDFTYVSDPRFINISEPKKRKFKFSIENKTSKYVSIRKNNLINKNIVSQEKTKDQTEKSAEVAYDLKAEKEKAEKKEKVKTPALKKYNIPNIQIDGSSISFKDSDGNNVINALEKSHISFKIINKGSGEGKKLKLNVLDKNSVYGLNYEKTKEIGSLKPNHTKIIEFPITASRNLQFGNAQFEISVSEEKGFGTKPLILEIKTKPFKSPLVKVADYKVSSSNNKIEKRTPFEFQLMIQNIAQGAAQEINIQLEVPDNLFCLTTNQNVDIEKLAPGESELLEYSFVANNMYSKENIPLKFDLSEKLGKYAKDTTINLALNQSIEDNRTTIKVKEKSAKIEVLSLGSDVDKNIPINHQRKKTNTYALIIGNENYTKYQDELSAESNVDFARNDATIFKKYCEYTLGIPEENIKLRTDAITSEMRRDIKWLISRLEYGGSNVELMFYYSGHGFPDPDTKEKYLVPVDITGADIKHGIKLSKLFKDLTKHSAKRITLFLDACFSGGGREEGLLAAKSVRIEPKKQNITKGNMVVFSASSGDQESLFYKEQQHGIFTYYLLKKIQETKGKVTYNEIRKYIQQKVPMKSIDLYYKRQEPQVNISYDVQQDWKNWNLR